MIGVDKRRIQRIFLAVRRTSSVSGEHWTGRRSRRLYIGSHASGIGAGEAGGRARRSWPETVGPWPSARAAESRGRDLLAQVDELSHGLRGERARAAAAADAAASAAAGAARRAAEDAGAAERRHGELLASVDELTARARGAEERAVAAGALCSSTPAGACNSRFGTSPRRRASSPCRASSFS